MQVRAVTESEWAQLRAVRLRALRDAPYAFGSSYEREAAFTEPVWRERASADPRHRQTFLATDAATGVLGMATVMLDGERADVVGVWVDPAARGRGVAGALMQALLAHARDQQATRAALTVTEGNVPARRLYERLGFEPTGHRRPLPRDPAVFETEMARLL